MTRAVFDSTVLISAFLRPAGLSDELLSLAVEGSFVLLLSPDILSETWRKLLTSTRLQTRYRYTDERAHSFCRGILRICEIIREVPPLTGVVRDPTDDMVVACAVAGRANRIVTRDKDLLSIGSYQEIVMNTPEEFRGLLRQNV
jgi:putative PIN family toxin of toxin-antitoxin system